MLEISLYDGEYDGDLAALTHLCDIEGSVVPEDRPPFSPLEETLRVLEMCADKYSTPRPADDRFTVFIGRKTGRTELEPLVRLDVCARNGYASASVLSTNGPRWDTERVRYAADDDVVTIVGKILKGLRNDGV
jgi:hypothetical protein